MKISNINQQVKRSDRYSIFINGKYSFALSESELLDQGLKVGQELSKAELESLKDSARLDKGIYRVMELISRRPRSAWEIRDYLKRKKYDAQEADKILNTLSNKGYINDKDFAKRWVESRRLLKPTSKRKLRLELKQKGVAGEVINEVLEHDETDERQILADLIAKKRGQTRYRDEQKLVAYLLRQGFNYSDIKIALSK